MGDDQQSMLVFADYFLPVELAAPNWRGLFCAYIAARDRAVDGACRPRRIAPVIGTAGSTGFTTNNRR
jgi:hypothetical protein